MTRDGPGEGGDDLVGRPEWRLQTRPAAMERGPGVVFRQGHAVGPRRDCLTSDDTYSSASRMTARPYSLDRSSRRTAAATGRSPLLSVIIGGLHNDWASAGTSG